jgi:hypothetical protein
VSEPRHAGRDEVSEHVCRGESHQGPPVLDQGEHPARIRAPEVELHRQVAGAVEEADDHGRVLPIAAATALAISFRPRRCR